MNTLLSDMCLRFCVRVGLDLLNNITNFVANVIERVRQAVLLVPELMCRLAHEFGGSGGGGENGFIIYGDYKLCILL